MNRRNGMVLLAAIAGFSACRREELSGPPTLRLGRDQCAGCGMILSEDRFAGALLVDVDGERTHLVFDDLGCMLDYRCGNAHLAPIEMYVRDYNAREWVAAGSAWYLHGSKGMPATPMGSGIVAFGSREAATSQQEKSGGTVMSDGEVLESHRNEQRPGTTQGAR